MKRAEQSPLITADVTERFRRWKNPLRKQPAEVSFSKVNASPSVHPLWRRALRWFFICTGICLLPFVVLAIIAISYYRLDRDAALMRQQVMAATDADWSTKVQVSVGQATLGAANFGLHFVRHKNTADLRRAFTAIRRASVGVYERSSQLSMRSKAQWLTDTDQAMQKHGWAKLVGVVDHENMIMVYVPQEMNADDAVKVCLAVVSERDLVVVSTKVDPVGLAGLIQEHIPEGLNGRLLSRLDPSLK